MAGNDVDEKLKEAARSSPEVAAMLAGVHGDQGPRYGRIVALVGATALALGGLWFGMKTFGPAKPQVDPRSEPATEVDRSEYLRPIKTERTAAGEETAPFSGFAVSIDSEPPGAVVSVGGKVRGEAPVLTTLTCSGDEKIRVRAEKAGFRPAQREIACRTDTLVKVTLRLER